MSEQPPVVHVQYVRPPSNNGIAIAGLILGITGAALALIPLLGLFLCGLPALLAIIFGFVGLSHPTGFRKKEAIWSVILGFSPPVIFILQLVVGGIINGVNGD